jgi:uncharacterized membrane protein YidH (DUF202 family)
MTQQGEKVKTVGKLTTEIGLVVAVLGVVLCVLPLFTTHVDYVGGRMVETQGTPSAFAIIMVIVGLVVAAIGFARRMIAAAERR